MSGASTITAPVANLGTEQSAPRNRTIVRPVALIAAAAKALWSSKVAVELAARAGVSVRSAENYLAGDRDMNGNALVRLIQSDAGPAFLEAIIADLPPSKRVAWRKQFEKAAERAELRRRLEQLETE